MKKKTILEKLLLHNFSFSQNQIFTRVEELHLQGLGFRKIAKIITNKTGIKCSKDTIMRWFRKLHIETRSKTF